MTTNQLLTDFVKRGGVITLYKSDDFDKPIRFSLKFNGTELSGKTTNLAGVLVDMLEGDRYDDNEWFGEYDYKR